MSSCDIRDHFRDEERVKLRTDRILDLRITQYFLVKCLDTVELIMEFEKEFGISIPDDQAEKITTVGDAIAYIEANAK